MSTYVSYGTEYLTKRLREHRRRLGLPLTYVSKALDIPMNDLEQYEYGLKHITTEELSKLANIYKVSPSYFLGGISV